MEINGSIVHEEMLAHMEWKLWLRKRRTITNDLETSREPRFSRNLWKRALVQWLMIILDHSSCEKDDGNTERNGKKRVFDRRLSAEERTD